MIYNLCKKVCFLCLMVSVGLYAAIESKEQQKKETVSPIAAEAKVVEKVAKTVVTPVETKQESIVVVEKELVVDSSECSTLIEEPAPKKIGPDEPDSKKN